MSVRLLADTVEKQAPGAATAEAAKLRAYQRAAHGQFVVPLVLDVDHDRDTIRLERIHGFTPMVEVYLGRVPAGADREDVFRLAGSTLARLHTISRATEPWVIELLGRTPRRTEGSVLLHGDYGFSNVLVRWVGTRPIVLVIDPGPNHVTTHHASTLGRPIDDMAVMASCILGRLSTRAVLRLPRVPRRQLLAAFRQGYEEHGESGCSIAELVAAGRDVLEGYLILRRGLPRQAARLVSSVLSQRLGGAR